MQALLVAGHSQHVVATDVNPRALAFTELNAALSGLDNVECRRGSLFEPVDGEQFDLITCNAPFVVSPERRWTYRDGSHDGDELSARIVRESVGASRARRVRDADGQLARARAPTRPTSTSSSWVAGSGCDSWILPIDEASPLEHAERWNAHLAGDGRRYGEALDRWMSYLDELGAGVVTEGAVILHRRDGHNTSRIDEIDEDELDAADVQIRRAFDTRARLDGHDLLDARLAPADALRVETLLKRGTRDGRARDARGRHVAGARGLAGGGRRDRRPRRAPNAARAVRHAGRGRVVPRAARARSARARGHHIRALSASTPATNGFVTL